MNTAFYDIKNLDISKFIAELPIWKISRLNYLLNKF